MMNQIQKDFYGKIENGFGLQKTDYPCEHTLEKQRESCGDLKRRIHELEIEMFL